MRPINLKIKGLNSFIDMQEINFEQLTHKGLFGIFGPTGSGKSTILDGITLALYGEVARKSSNFMNTNCDSLNVSYEFQITEKHIKRYRVDREFRRDNKTGSVRSKSAKVMDLSDGLEIILEEGIRQVTQKCEEIIGLKLEDFTRTVVLPQGNFSEFLKLEGKDRRDMLERLFNLQKYGDDLSYKLGSKIKVEKESALYLDGELKNYEEISDEILKTKKASLKDIKEQCRLLRNELNIAEKNFSEGKELWDLQVELKEKLEIKNKLKENEDSINEIKKRAELGTSILKVKPYIDSYESTRQQIDDVNTQLTALKINLDTFNMQKEKNVKLLDLVQNKKDNEIPALKVKEQRVIDAIEEKISLNKLMKENNILMSEMHTLNAKLQDSNNKLNVYDNNINLFKTNVSELENKIDSLKVDEEYKKKVNEGIILLNNCESIKKQVQNAKKEIDIAEINISEAQENSKLFSKNLNNIEDTLQKKEDELRILIENCPGDQNTLLNLQQHITNVKEKWDKYKDYSSFLNKSNENLVKITKDLKIYEEEKQKIEESIGGISDKIKKIERENIAITLRKSLSDGEACPVCGSNHHHKENIEIIDFSNLDELKSNLKIKEEQNKDLNIKINKLQANIETETANIKDREEKLKELGEEFKASCVEDLIKKFEKLKKDINDYNEGKTKLEKHIKELNEKKSIINIDFNKVNAKIFQLKEFLKKQNDDLSIKTEEFNEIDEKLSALKDDLSIEDFKSKSEEIFKKEKEKTALEIELKKKREDLIKNQELKDELNKVVVSLNEELKVKNTTVAEKNINIEDKKTSIKNKVGNEENLESLKDSITHAIKIIEDEYEAVLKEKKKIENQYNECNDKINSFQGNLNSLSNRLIKDKESLATVLAEEGIKDVKEANDNLISRIEIEKMLLAIEEYKAEITKLSGTIESLNSKIKNRSLSQEEWLRIQNIKEEKSKILETLVESNIKLEEEVKSTHEKLIYKKELLTKKEVLDHKLSILVDLEKLFKGKKFVEFVATNQLKYVSIEACKKLKEISGGQYGLEVDENGKFLIRDYKNGGAQRDASTLSGGETFVASLSLALALSAQIQLKGTAPLELFFLDEGFGTLDDNLMEVVMDSLEKIHNNRLSIGLISHVEAIKNRVPVKLIVTPAISGMGGSKVRIERN